MYERTSYYFRHSDAKNRQKPNRACKKEKNPNCNFFEGEELRVGYGGGLVTIGVAQQS